MKGRQPQESRPVEPEPSSGPKNTGLADATRGTTDDVETWDNEGGHDRSASNGQSPYIRSNRPRP